MNVDISKLPLASCLEALGLCGSRAITLPGLFGLVLIGLRTMHASNHRVF